MDFFPVTRWRFVVLQVKISWDVIQEETGEKERILIWIPWMCVGPKIAEIVIVNVWKNYLDWEFGLSVSQQHVFVLNNN